MKMNKSRKKYEVFAVDSAAESGIGVIRTGEEV
jgi:hypothetical protein